MTMENTTVGGQPQARGAHVDLPRELVAAMEALTTPDSEDWTLIPEGKVIHGVAWHEDTTPAGNRIVSMGMFKISRAELKDTIKSLPRSNCRQLGCITVIMCSDHARNGTADLLNWLIHIGRKIGFSVVVVAGSATTADAISAQKQRFAHWAGARRDQSQAIH
jgi:hypothetical protein